MSKLLLILPLSLIPNLTIAKSALINDGYDIAAACKDKIIVVAKNELNRNVKKGNLKNHEKGISTIVFNRNSVQFLGKSYEGSPGEEGLFMISVSAPVDHSIGDYSIFMNGSINETCDLIDFEKIQALANNANSSSMYDYQGE